MHNEQVFTPSKIVSDMLYHVGYKKGNIRKKHIIDNSCGDGAFLTTIVSYYITDCWENNVGTEEIIQELETYIHGIEIDEETHKKCIENLNNLVKRYFGEKVKVNFDIRCADALDVHDYDGKMDFVVGNPPYCRVQDLGYKYEKVKEYEFAKGGMTDLYLVFFEIGIHMLNDKGNLAYITPNSWFTSEAGYNFRQYLLKNNILSRLVNYGCEKVFENINTYTAITYLSKKKTTGDVFCYISEESREKVSDCVTMIKCELLDINECMIGGKLYLVNYGMRSILRSIEKVNNDKSNCKYKVKNGFATLNVKLFDITDEIKDDAELSKNKNVITTYKASSAAYRLYFFPYDSDGKPMKLGEMDEKLVEILKNKAKKLNVNTDKENWYLYGRTQGINDVSKDKIAINNLVRTSDDFKIASLCPNPLQNNKIGVYSGLYVQMEDDAPETEYIDVIKWIIGSPFMSYVKAVGKYKSSGYFYFGSNELEKWLNYRNYVDNG